MEMDMMYVCCAVHLHFAIALNMQYREQQNTEHYLSLPSKRSYHFNAENNTNFC